jgi:lipid II:glycine glycyltransferase (peptidoglycan interpeptide bridge formation enzyme)
VSSSSEILTALATRLCSQYSYQLLSNSPQLQDTRPLQNLGYTIQPRYTYVLDLRPTTDELWNSFDGHVRRQIKKAEKVGFVFADEIPPDAAYRLFRETFVRRGEKCPVAKAFLAELACGSILQHNRTVIAASLDSQVVAYVVLLKFKDTAYYSVASTAADHLQSGVSSLLIWKAIKALQADCIYSLDLVGANIPSIARFKEGFNPELRTFYQAEYFSGVHVKLGKKISRVISR